MLKLTVLVGLFSTLAHADGTAGIQISAPKVSASFDEKGFAASIAKARASLLACYGNDIRAPLADPAKATLAFKVQTTGRVTDATVTSELPLDMRDCVAASVQKVAFPKAKDTLAVSYELTFFFDQVSGIVGVQGIGTGEGRIGLADPRVVNTGGPTVTLGAAKTTGGVLDTAIIRRYFKRNAPKLQYCYEEQLAVNPRLAGRLTATFTIGADGKVSAATAAGIDNKDLAACFASVIQRLEFPRPKDGAAVNVTYPFELKPPPPAKKAPKKPAQK